MGSGASAGLNDALKAASPDELANAVRSLTPETLKRVQAALAFSWVEEFVICGKFTCKDFPKATEAVLVDAAIQVKKEPRAPRFTVMGGAAGDAPPPPADSQDKLHWLAEFECMDAWAGPEHKEREGNKEFTETFFSTGMNGDMMKDMDGSYTGKAWHLEKPGSSDGDVFATLLRAKATDAEAADKIMEIVKAVGPVQLEAEEGALRLTLMRTANMLGPLPKDDVTVQWIEVFRTAEDYAKHCETDHWKKEALPKIRSLVGDDMSRLVLYQFPATKHFAK